MAIVLTEKAANEVKRIMADQKIEPDTVLRVGVTGGGCSGFSYALGFDKEFDEKADAKYEYHGVPVVVDKKSALYLDGTTIDFYEGLEAPRLHVRQSERREVLRLRQLVPGLSGRERSSSRAEVLSARQATSTIIPYNRHNRPAAAIPQSAELLLAPRKLGFQRRDSPLAQDVAGRLVK